MEIIRTVRISKLRCELGNVVRVYGWVDQVRERKNNTFVNLRDGAGNANNVQVVCWPISLNQEAYICVVGKVSRLPVGAYSTQPVELVATSLSVVGHSKPDFSSRCPLSSGPDVKLDQRHLLLRDEHFRIVTQLRAVLVKAMRAAFEHMECTEIFPPCIVGNQCEGGATLFKLKHPPRQSGDDMDAFLTQSSQFYLEMALPALGDVYCIYPSFRAEHSHTRRHVTEFPHAECEWKNVPDLATLGDKLSTLLGEIIRQFLVLDEHDLLTQLGRREAVEAMGSETPLVVTHAEAIEYCRTNEIYADKDAKTHFGPRDDIPEAQEREMIDKINRIVLLSKFPREFKSFYCAADPDDPSYVMGIDVEVPHVGEIIGSAVRVHDADELTERIREQGLREEDYRELLDTRKYGHANTAGCGIGVDRMLCWLLGMNSIRDVITFPRVPGRIRP